MSNTFGDYLPYIMRGAGVTFEVFALGTVVWLISAFVLAFGRMSRLRVVRLAAGFVIEAFRSTSGLVQLFFGYYVLPLFGVDLSPLLVSVLVLGLNVGSYASEIVRGAVGSVSRSQSEAAVLLGLGPLQRQRYVILPQAILIMVPPFTNSAVDFLQFTSFVSLVTVQDITARALTARDEIGDTALLFTLLLVFYLAGTVVITTVMNALYKHLRARRGLAPITTGTIEIGPVVSA